MRILHISTRLILGGSQENTVLSCEGQANGGHEVHLAYGPIYGPEGSMLDRVRAFRSTDGRRIETHELPDLIREVSPRRDWNAFQQCRMLIRDVEPDIVHTHSSKAGVLGRAAAWKEGGAVGRRGVIHTIHGLPFHPYEKRTRNAMYIASERWAARRCHRIVTVCQAMRDQALEKGVGAPEQYTTVFSGMETEAFLAAANARDGARQRHQFRPEDFVIGTVARLAELKGHDDLLDALADDLKANPHWKLMWVGDGWWRTRLEKRIQELGLRQQVVLTGLVPPQHVPDLIAAMDVLVHPSYREGLPRTVPQALLTAVPVVAYNVDGAPEVCVPDETGLLVSPGDTTGLQRAIEWMAANPEARRNMAIRGQERCRIQFSAQKMVEDLERVYERVMSAIR